MRMDGINLPGTGHQQLINPRQDLQNDPESFQRALEQASKNYKPDSASEHSTKESDKASAKKQTNEELMDAAQQFEALFIQQMLSAMRDTVPESDLLDGGFAQEVYEGMLDQEYSDQMAKTGSFGLADKIYEQFTADYAGLSLEDKPHFSTDS